MTQAHELEQAILARAERLAGEYRERARRTRDAILREAADKLRLREQREEAIAKALGERTYRQQVQAEELRLQSHLDRVRWNLVRDVEARLAEQMQAHARDETRQLATLTALIATAATEIERDAVIVAANAREQRLLAANWEQVCAALPARTQATLADQAIDTLAGVLVTAADGRIRVDNTFEGRMARLQPQIQHRILERLLPSGFDTGAVFAG
ncbi:ATPase [Thiohalocapsa marina]|uniref:V-type ATP synthase subunit E n=1 Tax=Thiohalocapsa marina TaxID=424902 RepID=A0A5M8FLT2_9GAMM|nr:V-type ATP synthase subunit E family protein [Thiohalocapsa marina]KAA6184960.1 ATPase [Thiohalocapsa marina]